MVKCHSSSWFLGTRRSGVTGVIDPEPGRSSAAGRALGIARAMLVVATGTWQVPTGPWIQHTQRVSEANVCIRCSAFSSVQPQLVTGRFCPGFCAGRADKGPVKVVEVCVRLPTLSVRTVSAALSVVAERLEKNVGDNPWHPRVGWSSCCLGWPVHSVTPIHL